MKFGENAINVKASTILRSHCCFCCHSLLIYVSAQLENLSRNTDYVLDDEPGTNVRLKVLSKLPLLVVLFAIVT